MHAFTNCSARGPVHPWLEKFENDVFSLKMHQMFSVHAKPEGYKNATITSLSGFVFEKPPPGKSYGYREVIVFEKLRLQNVSHPH